MLRPGGARQEEAHFMAGGTDHEDPRNAFWAQRYAQVREPDGHLVDLFADLEEG